MFSFFFSFYFLIFVVVDDVMMHAPPRTQKLLFLSGTVRIYMYIILCNYILKTKNKAGIVIAVS